LFKKISGSALVESCYKHLLTKSSIFFVQIIMVFSSLAWPDSISHRGVRTNHSAVFIQMTPEACG